MRLLKLSVAMALAPGLAGCAHSQMTTGSINRGGGKPVEQMSARRAAVGGRARSARPMPPNPSDKPTALRYASVLQMNGDTDQSLAVMRKLAIAYPKDRDVLAAYGKALAAAGQFEPALDAVRRAQTPEYPDWKLASAEGAILDQLGDAKQARDLYRKALDLKPNEPSVLSNLGMSYVLEGDLRTAETYMRSAVGAAGRRQPRAPEPGARRRPAGPVRRGRADRQPGAVARTGAGQRRLSALDAVAAERLEAAQGRRQAKTKTN